MPLGDYPETDIQPENRPSTPANQGTVIPRSLVNFPITLAEATAAYNQSVVPQQITPTPEPRPTQPMPIIDTSDYPQPEGLSTVNLQLEKEILLAKRNLCNLSDQIMLTQISSIEYRVAIQQKRRAIENLREQEAQIEAQIAALIAQRPVNKDATRAAADRPLTMGEL